MKNTINVVGVFVLFFYREYSKLLQRPVREQTILLDISLKSHVGKRK